MKAIILAAGYATRLYPLTLNQPKALLPINNKPIIDYIVDELNSLESVTGIYVVSNHKFFPHFCEWQENAVSRAPIKVLNDGTTTDENKRGAIGDIHFCITEENIDEDVIVVAGDNFFTFTLSDYYTFYQKVNACCVCAKEISDTALLRSFAVAVTDDSSKVVDLVEKPTEPRSNLAVYATYIYTKDTLPLFTEYLDQGNNPDMPGNFPQWLYKRQPIYVYRMNGDCYDIGTPQSYEEVQKQFSSI